MSEQLSIFDGTQTIDLPYWFAEFWRLYPKKESKGHAIPAFAKACKHTHPSEIINALRGYRFPSNRQFQKLPATWLNARCWEDEQDTFDPVLRAVGLNESDLEKWLGR